MSGIISTVSDQSKERWFEKFARLGLVAKGIVYFLMGLLSVLAAFGLSRDQGDKTEAFKLIYDQPFGQLILVAIAIGLFGYVTLRIFQAFRDTENKGTDLKGIMTRVGFAISAFLYLLIGLYALKLALSGVGGDDGDSKRFVVSKILAYPAGGYIIGIASLIVIGSGIYQVVKGITGKFMKNVNLLRSNMHEFFKTTGMVGYIARGIVLVIVGYFLFHAAWLSNPSEARGTGAAFDFLQNKFGSLMMAAVALGLTAYGVFCFVKARYQKIDFSF